MDKPKEVCITLPTEWLEDVLNLKNEQAGALLKILFLYGTGWEICESGSTAAKLLKGLLAAGMRVDLVSMDDLIGGVEQLQPKTGHRYQ